MVKAIMLVTGAHIATLVVAAIASAITMALLAPRGCSAVSNAVGVLFVLIAVLFVASAVVVSLRARKITVQAGGRVAIISAYVAALLISYIVIAFTLMLAFNC